MSDELDTLDDAKLSEVFAVEVAGWTRTEASPWVKQMGYNETGYLPVAPDGMQVAGKPPSFATDADAVLPYLRDYSLEERPEREYFLLKFPLCKNQGWVCELWCDHHDGGFCEQISTAQTPARVCCIALIRAKRASK